jgi:suppressor of fused
MTEPNLTPGWEAIEAAFSAVYGDQQPLHWGPVVHAALGGQDPLDGVSAYRHDGATPHWHFVTYGFSELYAKESDDPDVSGFGFELTLRLAMAPEEDSPPGWVLNFLQNLGRYVFEYRNPFAPGHHMDLNGPICLESDTAIRAICFDEDPELPPIQTPNGAVTFLQITGVTLDELAAAKAWDTRRLLGLMASRLPLLVTDLDRLSTLRIPEIQASIAYGAARDGSSTGALYVDTAAYDVAPDASGGASLQLTLGANGVSDICAILQGRIPFDRDLVVASPSGTIIFTPSDRCTWAIANDGEIRVEVTSDAASGLAEAIEPKAGMYWTSVFPGLTVEVVQSTITDREGNVIEVIG